MSINEELFRFVTTRRPDRALTQQLNRRLIHDLCPVSRVSLLVALYGPGSYPDKLAAADEYARSFDFVDADDLSMLALEPAVESFRASLALGVALADLRTAVEAQLPLLAALLRAAPPADVREATTRFVGRLCDSMYAQVLRACDRYVSTNYLADALRVYHVLRLLWVHLATDRQTWTGGTFDEYEFFIDVAKAQQRRPGSHVPPSRPAAPARIH